MNALNNSHNKAMEFAELALTARAQGNQEQSICFFEKALEHELSAIAELDKNNEIIEPTYSVLHRSAGTLALDCNKTRKAEQIVAKALAQNPPEEIVEELRDLLEQIHFKRHLELRGIELGEDEIQLSLSGQDVGFGVVTSDEFLSRVTDSSKLIQRIVERKNNRPFRESGPPIKNLTESYKLFLSTPRAASFSVTMKLGRPTGQPSLPGIPHPKTSETNEIIDEFMDLVELANNLRISEIQERIPDPAYRRNFLSLAKKIAPDGERIRQVGFTTYRSGVERFAEITKPASELPIPAETDSLIVPSKQIATEPATIQGRLLYADSTKSNNDKIKLIDLEGKEHNVKVPQGMMNDIVRPMWNLPIRIKGVRKNVGRGSYIELQDIEPVETEPDEGTSTI